MATLLPKGKTQFFDANGNPLAAGSVYFYIPNTLTPKNTWQDEGQTTLNTNPVVLDSSGEAIIYGSGIYRQIVQDSSGDTIWDQLTGDYSLVAATMSQGTSAPTISSVGLSATAGVWWHDTSANEIKLRDQADTTWMPVFSIDETNKVVTPEMAAQLRGFIDGFETGAPGGAGTLTIGPGACVDGTNSYFMESSTTWTKTTGAWSAGTGGGALDTGTIAASTAYWVWEILDLTNGAIDYLFSLSSSAPTMPSGFTIMRLISWFKTDSSSHIWQFQQRGDEFIYGNSVADANGVTLVSSNRVLVTLSVPIGFVLDALFRAQVAGVGATTSAVFTSPDEVDSAVQNYFQDLWSASSAAAAASFVRRVNTSGQIGVRGVNTSGTYYIGTYGFTWTRGRNS